MDGFLNSSRRNYNLPCWDRFDICEAYYVFAINWHGGQNSDVYKIFGKLKRIDFRPAPTLRFMSLTDNGKMIYKLLMNRFYGGNPL